MMRHLPSPQYAFVIAMAALGTGPGAQAHAMPEYVVQDPAWRLWPNGVVYYELATQRAPMDSEWQTERLPVDQRGKQAVLEAMAHLQQKTDMQIIFIPSTDHPARLKISLMPWDADQNLCGQASVGNQSGQTLQIVDTPSCKTRAVALHELMHTLGFLHENQRYQAQMDIERRDAALNYYADKRDRLDHDSITFNSGEQGERLDRLNDATDTLIVRLRYGLEASGRWFQELSHGDVQAIGKYYNSQNTIQGKLERERLQHPRRNYIQLALRTGRCIQPGSKKSRTDGDLVDAREIFAPRCDASHAGQRWAIEPDGSIVNLDYPGLCLSTRAAAQPHQINGARPESDGGYALLEACRPQDASQRWQWNKNRLVNQAYPGLSLGFDPGTQNVLAWRRYPGFETGWLETREEPMPRVQLAAQSAPHLRELGSVAPNDPWRLHITPSRDDGQNLYRFKNQDRCLSAQAGDKRLNNKGEHIALLRPCDHSSAQQWMLRDGRIASLRYPGHCLSNTGLERPTDDQQPGFVGLQSCNSTRKLQTWTLRNINNEKTTLITAQTNPFVLNDYRVLSAAKDGHVYYGHLTDDRRAYSWQVERKPAKAPLTPIPDQHDPLQQTHIEQHKIPGRQIMLLGGNRRVTGKHCLTALGDAGGHFAQDEMALDMRGCDSHAPAQYWTLKPDGSMINAAYPSLCLGQNKNQLGKTSLYSYRHLGKESTGFAVLQTCVAGEPSQGWQWRSTRFYHQGDAKSAGTGDQLTLIKHPKLSLIFHAKTQDTPLSISTPDVANNFHHYRWAAQAVPGETLKPRPLAPRASGAFKIDWMTPVRGNPWRQSGPGYIGKNINMRGDRLFRPLRWHTSQLCLTTLGRLEQTTMQKVGVESCRANARNQAWRINAEHILENQNYPSMCLGRHGDQIVLRECRSAQARPHWHINDSNRLENLDYSPLALKLNDDWRQVSFDESDSELGKDSPGEVSRRWYWIEPAR